MPLTVMKQTHKDVNIKIAGATGDSGTLDISTLLATGQELDGATQRVNILAAQWTGNATGVLTLTRNGVIVMTLQSTPAGQITLDDGTYVPDNIENSSDIGWSITGTTGQIEAWIRLRKESGYKTQVEPEQFGSYDNPLVAGS